jgi:hypothetical protein
MALTYTTCIGMRGERTARGGRNGCKASVQSYDGSIIVKNWYDSDDQLRVCVDTNDGSSCCGDWNGTEFIGTFQELKDLLKLADDIKTGKVSIVRHRNKQ